MNPDFGLPKRGKLPHAVPDWVATGAVYFVTVCCQPRRRNQLCQQTTAATVFESVAFRQQRGDWYVSLLLLMPDHLHLLVMFPRNKELRRVITAWKSIIARQTGVQWQRDFFDHRLRAEESYEEKAHYIRQNPVRAALVSDAADWQFVCEPRNGGAGRPALPSNRPC